MTGPYERERQRTGGAILTKVSVGYIKWLVQHGESPRLLAKAYGVRPETIRRIGRGDTWTEVEPTQPGSIVEDPNLGPPIVVGAKESLDRFNELMNKPPTPTALDRVVAELTPAQRAQASRYGQDIPQGDDSDESTRGQDSSPSSEAGVEGEHRD